MLERVGVRAMRSRQAAEGTTLGWIVSDDPALPPATQALKTIWSAVGWFQVASTAVAVLAIGASLLIEESAPNVSLDRARSPSPGSQSPRRPLCADCPPCVEHLLRGDDLIDEWSFRHDEVDLFEEAVEEAQYGEVTRARALFVELTAIYPESPFAAHAHVLAAEAAVQRGDSVEARARYEDAIAYPPPDNSVYHVAALRLAQLLASSHPAEAERVWTEAVRGRDDFPSAPCIAHVAETAGSRFSTGSR